ncbi:MAG TPA: hypothetical protein VNV18_11115 [Stellaceae bacterium]|jgi:hypothetical protein|nr:hypothetical protein [Stellaceae bacterium]
MPVEARSYPRPLPNPEWLGNLREEVLVPQLPIVDPHHHLWDDHGASPSEKADLFSGAASPFHRLSPSAQRA